MKYSHEKYIESLISVSDVNQKVINQFLTLIHQYEVAIIIQGNDFLTPIHVSLLEKLDYCRMEIDNIIYSVDAIYCNSQLIQDINSYKQTLYYLTYYLSDKGNVDENLNFRPFNDVINKSYILNLRNDLRDIYQKYICNN